MPTPSPTVRRKRLTGELRRLREQAGLTCEDVGQRLECSGTRISRMETGTFSPRLDNVWTVAEALDVSLAVLFANVGDERPRQRRRR